MSEVREIILIIKDDNFFFYIDIINYMNDFTLNITVLTIISIWKIAVIDKTNNRIDVINYRVKTAEQSVDFNNTVKQMFIREIVIKQKKLLLLSL